MVVSEARNLAVKELLPTNKEGDEQGCFLSNGEVTVPESFHKAYELFCEGEWLAVCDDPKYGGQGMPKILATASDELFTEANCAFLMYPGLTHGAGKLVEEFGTEEQKRIFPKNLYTGKWAGTMCLTEPEAGSDVGNLTTTARRNEDGAFTISGNKIFISGGDQNITENIIHPVLARIEGAPAGTKGMKAMFVMMNEARFGVGMQEFGFATASYINAVNYAKERVQDADLMKIFEKDAKPVAIINHPDVKRQLLSMKAYVDGMRALLYPGISPGAAAQGLQDHLHLRRY